MNFFELLPSSVLTDALGDDAIYHGPSGPVAIKAMFNSSIDPLYSGAAHVSAKHKQMDVAKADVPGLKKGSVLTVDGTNYRVDDILNDDGQFMLLVLL